MKTILLTMLLALALCNELHYMHYKGGNLFVNNDPAVKVDGPIFIEFLSTMNITAFAGMHIKGAAKTPFGFSAKITKFIKNGDKIDIEASCVEGSWGIFPLRALKGDIRINGSFQKANYWGSCYHEATRQNFTFNATGNYVKCPIYPPPEAAIRARLLVGETSERYQPIHVVNFAVIGYPYVNTIPNCSWWLDKFFNETAPKPGFVVVGKDGAHCGIVDKEGDKLIHSNPVKKKITETPLSMIGDFFKNGYIFKDYKC